MTDFIIESRGGFDTNFAIVAASGYAPLDNENEYLNRIKDCIKILAGVRLSGSLQEQRELVQQLEEVRDRAVRELRRGADKFINLPRSDARDAQAKREITETYRIEGRYREWMVRINTIPFAVRPVSRIGQPDVFYDLNISTRDVDRIPPEKAKFKVKLDSALTVTKTVFSEREKAVSRLWWLIGQRRRKIAAVQDRWHEYINQLHGIASVALTHKDASQVALADQDLDRFKAEFKGREEGQVKNHYLWRLGFWCLMASITLSILYAIAYHPESGRILHDFRNFFLLATGAVIGAWLSFSLRHVTLSFEDLAILEEDRLNPSIRVLFIIGLVTVVGLLFWSGAIIGGIGDFQAGAALYSHGAWALLMGLLAGIAERAMGTAVSRRAGDFVATIGASGGPTATQVR